MQLPFAVYTARQGARWISGPSDDRAALERFRRAAGKMPEFDMGDPPSCGVINAGDTVVVYRFMCAKKADFRGRDAPYLALTYFPRSIAAGIDIERLLALEPFAAPLADPPSAISYDGGASAPSSFDPQAFPPPPHLDAPVDFSSAGALFASPFDGVLRLSRTEPVRAASLAVSYAPPAPPPSVVPSPQIRPPSLGTPEQSACPPPPFFRRHARPIAMAAASVALLAAMLVGWRLQHRTHAKVAAPPQSAHPTPFPHTTQPFAPPVPLDPWARLPSQIPLLYMQQLSPPAPARPRQPRPELCWKTIEGVAP